MSGHPTATVRTMWSRAADIYDEAITPALRDAHRALLKLLDPAPGERVLDLGCGTGRIAELVATESAARLVAAVDLSPRMVELARIRLAGHAVAVEEMDAQALRFADASFDAIAAGFSLMFCPDHAAAFGEARRVLRPGGRLVLAVWGLPEECDTVTIGKTAAAFGEGPLPDTPTGQALGDPARLHAQLEEAGFASVEMRSQAIRLRYPGPDACWQAVLHVHGQRIPRGRLAEAEAATRAEIARVGLPLRNLAWLVRATA